MLGFIETLEKEYIQFLQNNLTKQDPSYQLYYIESLNLCSSAHIDSYFGTKDFIVPEGAEKVSNSFADSKDIILYKLSETNYLAYYSLFNPNDYEDLRMGILTNISNLSTLEMVKTTPYRMGVRLVEDHVLRFKRIVLEADLKSASDLYLAVVSKYASLELQADFSAKIAGKKIKLNSLTITPSDVDALIRTAVKNFSDRSVTELESKEGVEADLNNILGDATLNLRMSANRTRFGLKATFRLSRELGEIRDISELGFEPPVVEVIRRSIELDSGLSVASGAVGQGKSNTLNSMVKESLDFGIEIMEISSPPEFRLPIPQIDYHNDPKYLEILVSKARRQALDMVIVGEMNSRSSASNVIDLVTSKVHVLTTFHLDRVHMLPYKLKSFLGDDYLDVLTLFNFVLNQRLIRKLCDNCKEEKDIGTLPENIRKFLQKYEFPQYHYYCNRGCESCREKWPLKAYGEILEFTPDLVSEMLELEKPHLISTFIRKQMIESKTLMEYSLIRAIANGEISPYILNNIRGVV